jgi:hypothetical protein
MLSAGKGVPTLIVFGHPECPCTKATVGELNSIMAKVNQRLAIYVLFVIPKEGASSWHNSALEQDAKRIPGVHTLIDEDGIEATRFNAQTSGQVVLYDENGKLVFSGGITSARGHSGDNTGKSAVVAFTNDHVVLAQNAPVFGCALYSTHDDQEKAN